MVVKKTTTLLIGKHEYQLAFDDNYLADTQESFEPEMVKLFESLISKEDYVMDIGANIGCTAILFADLASKVYAFEAAPSTYKLLSENIALSKLPAVETFNIGLGEAPGETTLTFSADNRSGGFVSDQTQANAGHIVEHISINTIDNLAKTLQLKRLDFIKIDVEGFELKVINGAKEVLNTYQPIVVLELNHWCLNAFQRTSVPDFFDALRAIFPVLYAVDNNTFLDLHDKNESYVVMYHHINHFKYPNIVAAYNSEKLNSFLQTYTHQAI